jgi:hypothetical protein
VKEEKMGKITAGALRVPPFRARTALIALAATAISALGAAATAQATDNYPCGPARTSPGGVRGVHYCPLWTGHVPVYDRSAITNDNPKVVGWLRQGGRANWFIAQCSAARGIEFHLGSYYNNWWAFTEADNRHWGWVSEVYFKGGGNNERDAGPLTVFCG